jgi:hypothetical protein
VKKYRIIIPSWAPLSVEMQAETGSIYPAFIQLSGQPLYAHIVHSYESIKSEAEIVIVLPTVAKDLQINTLNGFDVRVIYLDESKNIGHTVQAAASGISENQGIIIHMADTLMAPMDLENSNNTIFVNYRADLYRWTSIKKDDNGEISVVTDRDHTSSGTQNMVCVGVFVLDIGSHFVRCLDSALINDDLIIDPFFAGIELYSKYHALQLKIPQTWHDCGHIDTYYESRLNYQNLRHFNNLSYNSKLGLVTKRSTKSEAFRHQVRWFKQVPDELLSFLPRIYDSSDGDSPYITMELLSLQTLSDLYVNSRLEVGAWSDVANKLCVIRQSFEKYRFKSQLTRQIALQMYVDKTKERIDLFIEQMPSAYDLWIMESGTCFGLREVTASLSEYVRIARLTEYEFLTPIHGDLCFSNIMYDPRSRQIKLIDPRGEFGVPGIYGDPRYDNAKLMHSYSGGYDFIVSDRFKISLSPDGQLNCQLARSEYHRTVSEILDRIVVADENEREQCNAIQSLLFLSMLPLHCDKPERQLAMLYVGLNNYRKNLFK